MFEIVSFTQRCVVVIKIIIKARSLADFCKNDQGSLPHSVAFTVDYF